MSTIVTGGSGFIGSHLVDRLLERGEKVIVLDNLSVNSNEFLETYLDKPNFTFQKVDLLKDDFSDLFNGVETIWHMAANPDVRIGIEDTRIHLEQNILVTYNILEAMRKNRVKEIIFPSSSVVYGEAKTPTPEDYGPLKPISLYGASKLACEALISAYCHVFDMRGWVFRLANVIGPRSMHGVIYDFINKLKNNPEKMEILGDGNQRKSYIYIDDCIDAVVLLKEKVGDMVNVFNVGSEDWVTVKRIAELVSEEMGLNPRFEFTGGERGWRGDVPLMLLSIDRIKLAGWEPKYGSDEAVRKTVKSLLEVKS